MDRRTKLQTMISTVAHKTLRPGPEESLFDSGLLDSFALPDLVAAIEREFGIRIPDAELVPRRFDSIARIEQYIDSKS
jgi:acyl carrier protein